LKAGTALAPRIVMIAFAAVLLGVFGTVALVERQGRDKDTAAILAFQQASPLSRDDILKCLAQSRPTSLNLSRPEKVNSLLSADDYGTFGPLSLLHDDLQNPARHIVARVADDGVVRKLDIWTRPDVPLLPTDIAVLKGCTGMLEP
jgi:hypothetical protein